jgi:hypothetical protein
LFCLLDIFSTRNGNCSFTNAPVKGDLGHRFIS